MSIIDKIEKYLVGEGEGLTKKQEKNLPDPLKKAIKKKKGIKDGEEEEEEE